jgi:superfamily II DNA or RNA helicase
MVAGYQSRHLDSTMTETERRNTLNWFANTPSAILNNVGLFTTGFDEPTIETIMINKSTESMPLWLQMCGRGSRPTDEKNAFTIIDMGGNAVTHGDWCDSRDWENIFFNPPKKSDKEGVAPSKNCPKCDAIVAASARMCKYCGFEFPVKEAVEEKELNDFVIVTKGIDVRAIIEANKEKKEWYPFYKIGKDLAKQAKNTIPKMTDENAIFILEKYHELAKEWAHQKGKRSNEWCKNRAKEHLYTELQQQFKNWNQVTTCIQT